MGVGAGLGGRAVVVEASVIATSAGNAQNGRWWKSFKCSKRHDEGKVDWKKNLGDKSPGVN